MTLKIGDQAPGFEGRDHEGRPVRLADFRGKKVILYFYPKDDTPGCTAEACNLRDNYTRLREAGYEVIGVSADDEVSHAKFRNKYNLPFILVADPDHSINEKYGVWVKKSMFGKKYMGTQRTTFVIDEDGKIAEIIEKIKTGDHAAQILK